MILGFIVIMLSVAIGLLPSVYAVRGKKVRGKAPLTLMGKIILFCLVPMVVILQCLQIYLSEKEKTDQTEETRTSRNRLTKTFNTEINRLKKANEDFILKNNKSITEPYVQGLAKYGLKFDTSQLVIQKLVRDSLKTIVYNSIKPELTLTSVEVDFLADTVRHNLTLVSEQATAYNAKLMVYVVIRTKDDHLIPPTNPFPYGYKKIVMNNDFGINFFNTTDVNEISKMTKMFYYYVKASYENEEGKKYAIADLYSYRRDRGVMSLLTEKETLWVKDFCDKHIFE